MGLTDLQIKKLTPKSTFFDVPDGKGLYMRVMPGGSKTWVFRYMFDKKQRLMTLGNYPGISLAEAREAHAKALQDVQKGIDPGRKQKEAKAARKAAPTVSELIKEFWEIELGTKKSGTESKRLLDKDIIPAWGNRKAADIKRRDIVLLLDRIRERAPITGNRVQGALTRLFNFAAERGIIDDSPCTRIRKIAEKGRDRVLIDEEIRLLWAVLDLENRKVDMYRLSKLAMKMILLTGQRPGEVCGMTWDELNDKTWNIPAARMKGKQDHSVPLTRMAQDIIEQAKPYSSGSKFVFRSSYKEDSPMTAHALSRALVRHWTEIGFKEEDQRFTPHDLRRTLRTRLASLGVPDIIAERVLGHKLQGVLGVYNRHSYDQEKRQALEQWERALMHILGMETPELDNVVPFKRDAVAQS